MLPQQYQYVTENGETVMLVYETADGQQVVSENGEQIVFLVSINDAWCSIILYYLDPAEKCLMASNLPLNTNYYLGSVCCKCTATS